jgi:nucleoside-diphosphate-sugar epimerase
MQPGEEARRTVLVTGAGGFIGRHLLKALGERGFAVVVLERDADVSCAAARLPLERESPAAAWREGLKGIDAVVHLAGIAHRRATAEELAAVNERWPVELFQAAGGAGVTSFVWLSTLKVLGGHSDRPLRSDDAYRPPDAYARSKMEAETALRRLAGWGPTRQAILRPPLVYGPGVTANFAALARLARLCGRGLPLPLGAARAPRSLIYVANLCDLVIAALGQDGVFHCADDRDVTVRELLIALGAPPALLLPVPPGAMRLLARATGREEDYARLFESFTTDREGPLERLGWRPPVSVDRGLAETRAWFSSR